MIPERDTPWLSGPAGAFQITRVPLTFTWWRDDQTCLRCVAPGAFRTAAGWRQATQILDLTGGEGCWQLRLGTDEPGIELTLRIDAAADGFRLAWAAPAAVLEMEDRFDLAVGQHWFGQGELLHQLWPLELANLPKAPLRTWDNGPSGLGDIQEPFWVTASGAGIYAPELADPIVGLNAPLPPAAPPPWDLGPTQLPPGLRPRRATPGSGDGLLTLGAAGESLVYQVLLAATAPDVFRAFIARAGVPGVSPPENHLQLPIWTTWARFKEKIDQALVLEFAREIRDQGYPGGTLEIDAQWQQYIGDTQFDPERFPAPRAMVDTLHDLGFHVTLWTVPFCTPESANFAAGAALGYFARWAGRSEPYIGTWWGGRAAVLDVTQDAALAWYGDLLAALQDEVGLDGFKFDAGEACFMPADATTAHTLPPNELSQRYVAYLAGRFPYSEVRTGWRNQTTPTLFRQWDKFCTWGFDNGLTSIISQALTIGLLGYPFVLPDMVGGNGYFGTDADAELMIRWTQANILMPAIQFSLAPWDYGQEAHLICLDYAKFRRVFVAEILELARLAAATGEPIVRPVWWLGGDDDAFGVADEYLLGNNWLVAPVVTPGAVQRDVYLPAGRWQDYWDQRVHHGPGWLRDYPAPLARLPLFRRADDVNQ